MIEGVVLAIGGLGLFLLGMAVMTEYSSLPYGSAKAALEYATTHMAFEFSPKVRVNAIRCGAILTPDSERLFARDERTRPGLEAWTPMKRIGTPRDVARAAVYLASPAASFPVTRSFSGPAFATASRNF